jgi:hypothetical protein
VQGIKAGNNGIEEAMKRLGWSKVRGMKKVDGTVKTTPTFFAKDVGESASKADLYDLYQRAQSSTNFRAG